MAGSGWQSGTRNGKEERDDTGCGERAGRAGARTPVDSAAGRRRPGQCGGAHLMQPPRMCRAASAVRDHRPCCRGRPPQGPPARRPRPQGRDVLRVQGRGLPHSSARHRPACACRTLAVRRADRPGRDHRPGRTLVAGHGVLLSVCGRHTRSEDRSHLPGPRAPALRAPGPRSPGRGHAAVLRPPGRSRDGGPTPAPHPCGAAHRR